MIEDDTTVNVCVYLLRLDHTSFCMIIYVHVYLL
jgi:hypothetical protein